MYKPRMSKEPPDSDLKSKILKISAFLSDPGARAARAALRAFHRDAPPIFWDLLQRFVGTGLTPGSEDNWRLVIHFIACTTSAGGKNSDLPFGRACQKAGVSEGRVLQLLAARGSSLHQLVPRVCKMVASRGVGFDFTEVAKLILYQGHPSHEYVRKRILRTFVQSPQIQDEKEVNP